MNIKEQMQELVVKFATENQVSMEISFEVTKTVFSSNYPETKLVETYDIEDFQIQIK